MIEEQSFKSALKRLKKMYQEIRILEKENEMLKSKIRATNSKIKEFQQIIFIFGGENKQHSLYQNFNSRFNSELKEVEER